jgi:non-ribosomal peptide synthetase component F
MPCGLPAALAIVASLSSVPALAQTVSEDIHSPVRGPTEICGVTALLAADFIEAVDGDPRLSRAEINSDRFEMHVSADGWTQWVATLPTDPAHPAITCRHAYQDDAGNWVMNRQMRCDGSRATCDALFLEFQALDRALTEELKRTSDN